MAECRNHVFTDGQIEEGSENLKVENATTATLYIVAATNFVNYRNVSHDPAIENEAALASIKGRKYDELLKSHIQKYQKQYNRFWYRSCGYR